MHAQFASLMKVQFRHALLHCPRWLSFCINIVNQVLLQHNFILMILFHNDAPKKQSYTRLVQMLNLIQISLFYFIHPLSIFLTQLFIKWHIIVLMIKHYKFLMTSGANINNDDWLLFQKDYPRHFRKFRYQLKKKSKE